MRFQTSQTPLREQGFLLPTISPGRPALGTTGTTKDIAWRGDFREEVDWPFTAGPFRVAPYLVGDIAYYTANINDDGREEEHLSRL